MSCSSLQSWLDGRLPAAAADDFARHIAACARCQADLASWRRAMEVMQGWSEGLESGVVSDAAVRALVQEVERRPLRHDSRAARWWWVVAPLTAVAAGLAGLFVLRAPNSFTERQTASSVVPLAGDCHAGSGRQAPVETDAHGRCVLAFGEHRIGMSGQTQLTVDDSRGGPRVHLEHGQIALSVARAALGGKEFWVTSGAYTVQVVGTRFMVEGGERSFAVQVSEGTVRVLHRDGRSWTVGPGQGLRVRGADVESTAQMEAPQASGSIDQLLDATAVPEPEASANATAPELTPAIRLPASAPNAAPRRGATAGRGASTPERRLESWRAMLLQGRPADADAEMTAYLAANKGDAAVWTLLGDSKRKQGAWHEALAAYETAAATGDSAERVRALYFAAVIQQDRMNDARAAVHLLEEYLAALEADDPLRLEATLRLARALLHTGARAEGTELLRELLRRNPASPVASEARELLRQQESDAQREGNRPVIP